MDYKEESSADKQKRLNCNVGRGINGWNCYIDCASWDEHICTQFETATADELKPCPFCGGEAFVATIEHSNESRPNGYRYHGDIMCKICQASCGTTGFDETYTLATEKAIEAWNRRA